MADTTAIERELDRIRFLGVAELRTEWQQLNRGVPPKLSRELFTLALAYQLQEREGMAKSWQAAGTHKSVAYPGQHSAIVDQNLWDQVRATLAENRVERASGIRGKQPSLLTGRLFDATGERLTPTHAVKKGMRYRYYISTGLITGKRKPAAGGWRIPAGDLEGLVINRLRALFIDHGELLDTVAEEASQAIGTRQLIERGRSRRSWAMDRPTKSVRWSSASSGALRSDLIPSGWRSAGSG